MLLVPLIGQKKRRIDDVGGNMDWNLENINPLLPKSSVSA
jgi:hypothetical protein